MQTLRHRPVASLSLDLDNLRTSRHGQAEPDRASHQNIVPVFVAHVLDTLERADLRATFFVARTDAQDPENTPALRSIVTRGHEIGHYVSAQDCASASGDDERLAATIDHTHNLIRQVAGVRPIGFRGPGLNCAPALLRLLRDRGYLYDASAMPASQGSLEPVSRCVRPYRWMFGDGAELLEIPVTGIPVLRTPFDFGYLGRVARVSRPAMAAYLQTVIALCRLSGTAPSLQLNPLDVIGSDLAPVLSGHPGMEVSSQDKTDVLLAMLAVLRRYFDLGPISQHAHLCKASTGVAVGGEPQDVVRSLR